MKHLIIIILLISCMSCGRQNIKNNDTNVIAADTPVVQIDTFFALPLMNKIYNGMDTFSMLPLMNKIYNGYDYKILYLCTVDSVGYQIDSTNRIELTLDDKILASILLPINEILGFGVDSIRETGKGFMIYVSWGGGNYYYEGHYDFVYRDNHFYFDRIKMYIWTPDDVDNSHGIKKIRPPLDIDKFDIYQYLSAWW